MLAQLSIEFASLIPALISTKPSPALYHQPVPVTISTFFLLYYLLPNGKVPARPMLRAAVFAGLLTEVVKYLYMWSLPWLDFKAAYGPFSASVTILFWAFCASMILLMGAHASATPAATQGGA